MPTVTVPPIAPICKVRASVLLGVPVIVSVPPLSDTVSCRPRRTSDAMLAPSVKLPLPLPIERHSSG